MYLCVVTGPLGENVRIRHERCLPVYQKKSKLTDQNYQTLRRGLGADPEVLKGGQTMKRFRFYIQRAYLYTSITQKLNVLLLCILKYKFETHNS